MAAGLGLAIVASIVAYERGGLGPWLYTFLPSGLFLCTAGAYGIQLGILDALGRPTDLRSLPIVLGMVVFGTAALFGGFYAVPRIYERHVERMKHSAVQAVEGHRKHTGRYPDTGDEAEGLPDDVSYRRSENTIGYGLFISDRFHAGYGWHFKSSARKWTYGYEER